MDGSPFDLTGRVAIVTGGNGGIGLGMARGLAQAGAAVVVAARNATKSAAAVKELEGLGGRRSRWKWTSATRRRAAPWSPGRRQRFGRIDILVNNAGTNIRKLPEDLTLAEWREVLDTNLTSAFIARRRSTRQWSKAGGGKIISIGSMLSIFGGPLMAAYGAEQGRHRAAHRALAAAWGRTTSRRTRSCRDSSTPTSRKTAGRRFRD